MIVVYCSDLLIAYSWAYLQLLKPWLKTQGGLSTCSPLHSCTVSPRGSSTGTGFTAGTHCQAPGAGLGKAPVTARTLFLFPLQRGRATGTLQAPPVLQGVLASTYQTTQAPAHLLCSSATAQDLHWGFFYFSEADLLIPSHPREAWCCSSPAPEALGADSSVTLSAPWREPRDLSWWGPCGCCGQGEPHRGAGVWFGDTPVHTWITSHSS